MKELHVDHSKVKSIEDIDALIEKLPQGMARIVKIKLARVAENPNKLKWISKRLSRKFNVAEEELLEEAKAVVEQYIHFKAEKNATESESKESKEEKKTEYHPARCDSCKIRIKGIRYWCLNCKNFDLCSECEEKNTKENFHDEKHIFAKIKEARTAYRAFPMSEPQGKRCRLDPSKHRMANHCGKGRMEVRLRSLEESVQLLRAKLNEIENK